MAANGKTERSSVYEAIAVLRKGGFFAERVVGQTRLFDIIAWSSHRTLCIVVRSSRQAKLSAFRDGLTTISRMIALNNVPGDVQFWIYRIPGWNFWKVTSGGATPIEDWQEERLPMYPFEVKHPWAG